MRELSERLGIDEEETDVVRPCKLFDLICGTASGGLIAILLGRFGLPSHEATDLYGHLMTTAWINRKSGEEMSHRKAEESSPSTDAFVDWWKTMSTRYAGSADAAMKMQKGRGESEQHPHTKVSSCDDLAYVYHSSICMFTDICSRVAGSNNVDSNLSSTFVPMSQRDPVKSTWSQLDHCRSSLCNLCLSPIL